MPEQRVPIPLPVMGISAGVAADQQRIGTCQRALNVRGVDPVSDRVRVSQRSGLASLVGGATPSSSGSPPRLLTTVVRDTPTRVWSQLTTTPDSASTPTALEAAWEIDVGADPLAAALGPQGNAHVLLDNGDVVVLNPEGEQVGTIPSQVPVNFRAVPAIAVSEQGAVFVMAEYPRRIDGGAGRLFRMIQESSGAWRVDGSFTLSRRPVWFAYDLGELVAITDRPDDYVPGTDPFEPLTALERYTSAHGFPSQVAARGVPHPAVRLSFHQETGDIYLACPTNADRQPDSSVVGTPSIGWTPYEASAANSPSDGLEAAQALYWHTSALRAQNVQGLVDGEEVETWVGGRSDDTDHPAIIDKGGRAFVDEDGQPRPTFDPDGFSGTPGLRFDPTSSAQWLRSLDNTGCHEKNTANDTAQHSRTVFPCMSDPSAAKFMVVGLFRMKEYGSGGPHYIFDQSDGVTAGWALYYDDDGAGGIDLTFQYPTGAATVGTDVQNFAATTDETFLFTFVHDGASSFWHVNGDTTTGATGLAVVLRDETGIRTYLGDNASHSGTDHGMNGWVGEVVTFLGGSSATASPHDTANVTALRERTEGYIAWAYGRQALLPGAHTYNAAAPAGTGDSNYTYGIGTSSDLGILAKYARADLRLITYVQGSDYGNGVVAGPDDRIYSVGTAIDGGNEGNTHVQLIHDEGRSFLTTGGTVWGTLESTGLNWLRSGVDLTVDEFGNLYVPWSEADATSGVRSIRRYGRDGNGLGGPDLEWEFDVDGADAEAPLVALPAGLSVTDDDVNGPEYLIALYNQDAANETVRRVTVLGRAASGASSPRATEVLAVCDNGDVARASSPVTATTWTSVATGVLAGDEYWSATLYRKTYIGDGRDYRVYDHEKQTLDEFTASTRGEIPPRARLGVAWRGRLVLARGDDAHNWHMSAVADPLDWDTAPEVVVETQAVSGSSSQVGEVPDIINTLIPWSDDLMVFGCDHSVYRLTGDPMVAGQMHRLSDVTGIAFGRSWCKDPEGRIWFFGSRGGLFAMTPGGLIESVSEGRIERRLEAIDLSDNRVELEYNYFDDAVHIFVVPRDSVGTPRHFAFERRTGGWWEDEFQAEGMQVTAAALLDGDDPKDRQLVLAGRDGKVRRWDSEADDDDGEPIFSTVLIGPTVPDRAGREVRVSALEPVFAVDQDGAEVALHATPHADLPPMPRDGRYVSAGRTGRLRVRARGSHLWVSITNTRGASRWSLEDLAMYAAPAGRKRGRPG